MFFIEKAKRILIFSIHPGICWLEGDKLQNIISKFQQSAASDTRCPWKGHGTPDKWLQVDLRTPTTVTGVVTQGSVGWRVTSFKISFGDSNNHLQVILDVDGNDMIFQDNTEDTDNHVQNIFSIPIRARFFRLIAVTYYARSDSRLDYVTC
ncbi:unnamed protein product [Clavelina lepadiformis]|uniref:F5/8 type C domain-containing protein n=1 Tax=Clavelina lepadiformis TaxID=159417 RepID=A0ABP0EWY6_CLALP